MYATGTVGTAAPPARGWDREDGHAPQLRPAPGKFP